MNPTDEKFIIANPRNVPLYRYDKTNDDADSGWIVYHSKKYLRRQKKLEKRNKASKKL